MKEIPNAEIELKVLGEIVKRHGPMPEGEDGGVVYEVVRLTLGALDEQRQEAREAQLTIGDLTFRDFTKYPEQLTALIDKGHVSGIIGMHRIREPGQPERIGFMAGGISSEQAFVMMCTVRRTLMLQLGLSDPEPYAEATQEGASIAAHRDHPPTFEATPAPNACSRCGIGHWSILSNCRYEDCPHGLYRS